MKKTGPVSLLVLSATESAPYAGDVCGKGEHGLTVGDTVEAHYVYSSADVTPGPTLGACMNDAIQNPQLRVETVVMVLVNDQKAADMMHLSDIKTVNGKFQTAPLPGDLGTPVEYAGSTTGPAYNSVDSPFQVWWSVRPLVTAPEKLSPIGQ